MNSDMGTPDSMDSGSPSHKRKTPEDTDGDALSPRKQPTSSIDVNDAFQVITENDVADFKVVEEVEENAEIPVESSEEVSRYFFFYFLTRNVFKPGAWGS